MDSTYLIQHAIDESNRVATPEDALYFVQTSMWRTITERRANLIYVKHRSQEQWNESGRHQQAVELEVLDNISRRIIKMAYPAPTENSALLVLLDKYKSLL